MATNEEIKVIEKLVRAKVKLEGMIRTRHIGNCMVDVDPEYIGPCTCGMDEHNRDIRAALKELSFDK